MENQSIPPAPAVNQPQPPKHNLNLGRIFFGVVVAAIGLLYLAQSLGYLENVRFGWNQLWPLLIIFVGLSLLRSRALWVVAILVLVIIAVPVGIMFGGLSTWQSGSSAFYQGSVPLDAAAQTAEVVVDAAALDLRINPSVSAATLVEVTGRSSWGNVVTDSQLRGTKQRVNVALPRQHGMMWWSGTKPELTLTVSNAVPLDLTVESGAASMDLDLEKLPVHTLNIDSGASSIEVAFGALVNKATALIDSGASSIEITVPTSLGVQVNIDGGLSSKELPGFESVDKTTYRTNNFATAEKTLVITISAGVSSIEVTRVP